VCDRVQCISTPGKDVDVLITQRGVAVNPKNEELILRLRDARIPVVDIHELKYMAEKLTGVPQRKQRTGRTVANVIYRDGTMIDQIKSVK